MVKNNYCLFSLICGCSSTVEQELPKLKTGVQLPSPAPFCANLSGLYLDEIRVEELVDITLQMGSLGLTKLRKSDRPL